MGTRYGRRVMCRQCEAYPWGLGRPLVDKAVHEARKRAHLASDVLWKSKRMTRTEAYITLAKALSIGPRHCHMAQMDLDQCEAVIAWADGQTSDQPDVESNA